MVPVIAAACVLILLSRLRRTLRFGRVLRPTYFGFLPLAGQFIDHGLNDWLRHRVYDGLLNVFFGVLFHGAPFNGDFRSRECRRDGGVSVCL